MVTLTDIAARAGVSTVTVSKALSGKKGVSEEVRERILRIADEMGYRKAAGKGAEREEPVQIGILVASRFMQDSRSFYWSLIQEITVKSLEKNCFCVLEAVERKDEEEARCPSLLTGDRVDGLLVLGAFSAAYEKELVSNARVPVLFVDNRPTVAGYDAVMSDNYSGGLVMTEYLFSRGCRRIAFVGTLLMTSSIDERFFGYTRALLGHGMRPEEHWLIPDRDPSQGEIDPERCIQLPEVMPDAFFCNCDVTARFLIEKLRKAGFRVPEDVMVAGYDNYLIGGGEEEAGITTYAVDSKGMAARALHMILHKVKSDYSYGLVTVSGALLRRTSA